jgi:hypothetical protein
MTNNLTDSENETICVHVQITNFCEYDLAHRTHLLTSNTSCNISAFFEIKYDHWPTTAEKVRSIDRPVCGKPEDTLKARQSLLCAYLHSAHIMVCVITCLR